MSAVPAQKGMGLFAVIAVGFMILLGLAKCDSSTAPESPKRIDQEGIVGVWFDDVGEAETKIEKSNYTYKLKRVNSDGSAGTYRLRRDGDWLYMDDNFGTRYQINGDQLEVFDGDGYIRSMDLLTH